MRRRDGAPPSRAVPGDAASARGAPPDRRLASFDGLRAVAAFCVIGVHVAAFGRFSEPAVQQFAAQLQAGVQVFFVISGFLLSKPFVAALLDDRPFTRTGPYAQRRFFRLFPAYWAALVITATVLDQVHLESLTDWIVHLTLLQAYSEGQFVRQLGVAWSLSVEVAFYAFLPLYFIALRALGGRAAPLRTMWLGNATLLVGGSAFVLWTDSWLQLNVIAWLPFEMPVFAVGIALAILHELRSRDRGPRRAIDVVARIAGWGGSSPPRCSPSPRCCGERPCSSGSPTGRARRCSTPCSGCAWRSPSCSRLPAGAGSSGC